MYHLASLALPFQGDTIPEISKHQKIKKPKKIPRIYSKDLKNIIDSMLNKEPDLRPTPRQILNKPET